MLLRNILFPSVIAPLIGAAVGLVLLFLWRRFRTTRGKDLRLGAATAVLLAFLAGAVALTGWPRWLPVEATQRLFYLSILAGVLGTATALLGKTLVRVASELALLGFVLVALLQTPIQYTWTSSQAVV